MLTTGTALLMPQQYLYYWVSVQTYMYIGSLASCKGKCTELPQCVAISFDECFCDLYGIDMELSAEWTLTNGNSSPDAINAINGAGGVKVRRLPRHYRSRHRRPCRPRHTRLFRVCCCRCRCGCRCRCSPTAGAGCTTRNNPQSHTGRKHTKQQRIDALAS